jgi:hypothetical protein
MQRNVVSFQSPSPPLRNRPDQQLHLLLGLHLWLNTFMESEAMPRTCWVIRSQFVWLKNRISELMVLALAHIQSCNSALLWTSIKWTCYVLLFYASCVLLYCSGICLQSSWPSIFFFITKTIISELKCGQPCSTWRFRIPSSETKLVPSD